jgi:hypothetical protein
MDAVGPNFYALATLEPCAMHQSTSAHNFTHGQGD